MMCSGSFYIRMQISTRAICLYSPLTEAYVANLSKSAAKQITTMTKLRGSYAHLIHSDPGIKRTTPHSLCMYVQARIICRDHVTLPAIDDIRGILELKAYI